MSTSVATFLVHYFKCGTTPLHTCTIKSLIASSEIPLVLIFITGFLYLHFPHFPAHFITAFIQSHATSLYFLYTAGSLSYRNTISICLSTVVVVFILGGNHGGEVI